MKIINEYYVLIRPNTHKKESLCTSDCETVFLNADDSFVTEITEASKYMTRKCANMILRDYEDRNCNSESSGFTPIYVRNEITY